MTAPRVQCSTAGFFRDRHVATTRQYEVIDPEGQRFVFCSACCLLYYACYGLPADTQSSVGTVGGEAA
jgi:hypothetical protein